MEFAKVSLKLFGIEVDGVSPSVTLSKDELTELKSKMPKSNLVPLARYSHRKVKGAKRITRRHIGRYLRKRKA
jgi:hypothetical protein